MAAITSKRSRADFESDYIKSPRADANAEGINDADSGEEQDSAKKSGKKAKHSHKIKKSKDELLSGSFVGEVYKSNLFKLQLDELLNSITPKFSRREGAVKEALHAIKDIVNAAPDREPMTISDAEKHLLKTDRIAVPFPEPRPKVDSNYKMQFTKPCNVNLVGSYPLKTTIKSGSSIILDLIVTMPEDYFQEKDYLNYRYFAKRAYYIACIAAAFKSTSNNDFIMTFEHLHGNQLLPTLVLEPQAGGQFGSLQGYRIRVMPVLRREVFNEDKLHPQRNCVRSKSPTGVENPPTPVYNGTIMQDLLVTPYLALQSKLSEECDAYSVACSMGRVWLLQRGLSSDIPGGGFGNFEWSVLVALLLQGGGSKGLPLFSQGYSSYQLFKATLQFLSSADFVNSPQTVGSSSQGLKGLNSPIFFDTKRGHNILYKMSPSSFQLLKHEAQVSLLALADASFDPFDATFIAKTNNVLYRYDALIEFSSRSLTSSKEDETKKSRDLTTNLARLYQTLTTALTTRVELISIHQSPTPSWALESKVSSSKRQANVTVGFVFNSAQISRTVDHGPSAEANKEAAEFRKFWGEKAELRRFRDGSILESLVWSQSHGEPTIFRQVLSYALKRHFGTEFEKQVTYVENQEDKICRSQPSLRSLDGSGFPPLLQQFKQLEEKIRAMDDLPLRVTELLPTSSQISATSLVPPIDAMRRMSTPADLVMRFESSTKWPDDLEAIQRTKIAFLMKLGESVENSFSGVKCRVGLENEGQPLLNRSFLDVVFATGIAFRLRIHHDREATIMNTQMKGKSIDSDTKTRLASALAYYNQTFVQGPAHCQAIQTLSTRFPALCPAIRLLKQWFSAHLLSAHFAEPLIEMFAAKAFTLPFPWSAPASPFAGFLRTLVFLSKWDWRNEPWIANLGTDPMTESQVSEVTTRLEAWRKIDLGLNRVVLVVASSLDGDGTTWTDHARPPKVVASRMTALAKAAIGLVNAEGTKIDVTDLFSSDLSAYDFVITMNPKAAHLKGKQSNGVFKNIEMQSKAAEEHAEALGPDSFALFTHDLESIYANAIIWFYDPAKRDVIAGLWNPQTKRPWKLKLGYSSVVDSKTGEADANRNAILNEIGRLGGDLISKITPR